MPSPLAFGAIGDDLTGSVELAGVLAAGGSRTALYTSVESLDGGGNDEAIVIALRSRVAPPELAKAAFARAGRALLGIGARQLFYKYCATFDSTPQGNIGPCADMLSDLTGDHGTLFCPSFPEADRTVYRGHLFVGDQLVSDSPKRLDPLTPMTEPDLVKVLQPQTRRRVGLLPHGVVAQGAAAIARHMETLRANGVPYAIADAIDEADLANIAEASWNWPLMTGGSSVAAHYPAIWRRQGLIADRPPERLPAIDGPAAVLAGSCADRTREQIVHFARHHPVLDLDIVDDRAPDQVVRDSLSWAKSHLGDGPICITTSADPARVEAAQRTLGRDGAARRAEELLGRIAAGLAAEGVRRLVVAGGETSGAVIDALGVRHLQVAPYRSAGIGLCHAHLPEPMALCLKSGKLGAVDLFEDALDSMRRGS